MIRISKAVLDHPAVTRFIQLVAIISLGIGVYTSQKIYQLTSCVATYNDVSNRVNKARAVTYERTTQSEDEMWLAFNASAKLPPEQATKARQDALNQFLAQRAQAKRDRDKYPQPAPPSQTCR